MQALSTSSAYLRGEDIVYGNAVTPPQLPADTPVLNVVKPPVINLLKPLWHNLETSVFHCLQAALSCQSLQT